MIKKSVLTIALLAGVTNLSHACDSERDPDKMKLAMVSGTPVTMTWCGDCQSVNTTEVVFEDKEYQIPHNCTNKSISDLILENTSSFPLSSSLFSDKNATSTSQSTLSYFLQNNEKSQQQQQRDELLVQMFQVMTAKDFNRNATYKIKITSKNGK